MIYLDDSATTKVDSKVLSVVEKDLFTKVTETELSSYKHQIQDILNTNLEVHITSGSSEFITINKFSQIFLRFIKDRFDNIISLFRSYLNRCQIIKLFIVYRLLIYSHIILPPRSWMFSRHQ